MNDDDNDIWFQYTC